MESPHEPLPQQESYLVEFKNFSHGVSVKELAITLTAFANTDGGSIYLGVTDRGQIHGLAITPTLLDHVQNSARECCSPPVSISLKQLPVSGKTVLRISVDKSGHLHSTASGQTYVRVGTQDKRVLGDELLRLAETKSSVSYEEHLLNSGTETLDAVALDEYVAARKGVSPLRGKLSYEELLIKIGLAAQSDGGVRIKAGAFVLFGKEGESLLLQRDFTFVRYEAEGKMYAYREDLSLPASRLIDRLLELIRPHNRITRGVKGMRRQEKYVYPEEAIREAVLNAVAHRDYRIAGLKNECRLYPARLEIISAGSLPGIITLENIGERHYSRNPKIMQALLMLGLTEELGQGITLMKNALKQNGNPPPQFSENADQFKVAFLRSRLGEEAPDIRRILDDYFSANSTATRPQVESLCGIKPTKAKYLLQKLIHEKYIEKLGDGPATRYRKRI